MNIFVTHPTATISAKNLCDRHVVKMTLETAQILSTAMHQRGVDGDWYKPTHAKHPCTLWAGASDANLRWLIAHGIALSATYAYRFGKVHGSDRVIMQASRVIPSFGPVADGFVYCGTPQQEKDVPTMYRALLREKYRAWADKGRPARYTNATPPEWLADIPLEVL